MGFKRPASWRHIVLIALAAAVLRILLGQFVIEPVTGVFWPTSAAPELANEITGNAKLALLALLIVWTFAAFGEEIAYRGYLLTRAADVETNQHRPTGLASCSSPFYLDTAIIIKGRRESLIPELRD
jgi:membrane protease YdiL (CAAX protease family)